MQGGGAVIPPVSYRPVSQVHIKSDATAHRGSLPSIVIRHNMDVVFHVILYPQSATLIVPEVIQNMGYATVTVQGVCGE